MAITLFVHYCNQQTSARLKFVALKLWLWFRPAPNDAISYTWRRCPELAGSIIAYYEAEHKYMYCYRFIAVFDFLMFLLFSSPFFTVHKCNAISYTWRRCPELAGSIIAYNEEEEDRAKRMMIILQGGLWGFQYYWPHPHKMANYQQIFIFFNCSCLSCKILC